MHIKVAPTSTDFGGKANGCGRALMHIKAPNAVVRQNRGMHRVLATLLLALMAAAGAACSRDQVFTVTGVVRTPLEGDQLVIAHDEIPGYMPAMTMAFTAAEPEAAATLRAGDRVAFRYRVNANGSRAEAFTVVGHEAPPAAGPARAARSPRLRAGDLVPAFTLVNERGEAVTASSWLGQYTIVTFIFTRCPVPEFCPAMALRFGELQTAIEADPALRDRVRLVSITLDPEFDRPEILQQYGAAIGARPERWSFATGELEQVMALARAFAVYREANGVTLDHTLCTALIGPDGRVVELWRGHGWKSRELLDVLNTL